MKKFLQNLWFVVKVCCWPVLLGIGQFMVAYLLTLFYVTKNDISSEFMKTEEFSLQLNQFMLDTTWVVFLWNLILIAFFYHFYKKNSDKKKKESLQSSYVIFFFMGSGLGIFLNIILSFFFPMTSLNGSSHLWMQVVTVGITGPILEELIFRGIMLEKLKTRFSHRWCYLIVILSFAFLHGDVKTILYAGILGCLFLYGKEKTGSLWAPILMHVGANTMTLFLEGYFTSMQVGLLLASGLLFLTSTYFFFQINQKNKKVF